LALEVEFGRLRGGVTEPARVMGQGPQTPHCGAFPPTSWLRPPSLNSGTAFTIHALKSELSMTHCRFAGNFPAGNSVSERAYLHPHHRKLRKSIATIGVMETAKAESPTALPFTQTMFIDPTGGALKSRVIAQFAEMLAVSDLSNEHREAIAELLIVIALKFTAVWTHDQFYKARELELVAAAESAPIDWRTDKSVNLVTAQELYLAFDGFLVQLKSALDHMMNVLHYTLGINFAALTTFGKGGDHVISLLENNVAADGRRYKAIAARLVKVVQNNQDWLKELVDARDRMNHFRHGGFSPKSFVVFVMIDSQGTKTLHRPEMSKKPIKVLMDTLMRKLLEFVEYFIGVAIAARLPRHGLQWNVQADSNFETPRWTLGPADDHPD
jgi:hypothetical protein